MSHLPALAVGNEEVKSRPRRTKVGAFQNIFRSLYETNASKLPKCLCKQKKNMFAQSTAPTRVIERKDLDTTKHYFRCVYVVTSKFATKLFINVLSCSILSVVLSCFESFAGKRCKQQIASGTMTCFAKLGPSPFSREAVVL